MDSQRWVAMQHSWFPSRLDFGKHRITVVSSGFNRRQLNLSGTIDHEFLGCKKQVHQIIRTTGDVVHHRTRPGTGVCVFGFVGDVHKAARWDCAYWRWTWYIEMRHSWGSIVSQSQINCSSCSGNSGLFDLEPTVSFSRITRVLTSTANDAFQHTIRYQKTLNASWKSVAWRILEICRQRQHKVEQFLTAAQWCHEPQENCSTLLLLASWSTEIFKEPRLGLTQLAT